MFHSTANSAVRRIQSSQFLQHVLELTIGTGIAQALPILVSPVLTRIYGPTEFGAFGLFWGMSAVVAMMATGRYEVAILIPSEDHDASQLVALCHCLATISCAVAASVCFLFREPLAALLNCPTLETWLPLVPLTALIMSWHQTLAYWHNRRKQYKVLARNRVLRSIVLVIVTIVAGTTGFITTGLILGALAGHTIAYIDLLSIWKRDAKGQDSRVQSSQIVAMAKRYRRFAIYSTPGDTINAITIHMPLALLSSFFGPLVAGYYGFTQRVLLGPASIVSRSIGDVFRQRACEEIRKHGSCQVIWMKTFTLLLLLSVPIFLLVAIVAPSGFALLFGEQWRVAGKYAQVLTPYFMLSFTASIMGRMTQIVEKQKQDLIWQAVLFLLVIGSLMIGVRQSSPMLSLALFSTTYSAMYVVYLWMSYCYSHNIPLASENAH